MSCLIRTCFLQIYKESRTLIIEKYRESTKQRLEFPAVREAVTKSGISTDHEGLRRIYDFLDAWGLINYEASDGAGHSLESLPPAVAASGASLSPNVRVLVHAALKQSEAAEFCVESLRHLPALACGHCHCEAGNGVMQRWEHMFRGNGVMQR